MMMIVIYDDHCGGDDDHFDDISCTLVNVILYCDECNIFLVCVPFPIINCTFNFAQRYTFDDRKTFIRSVFDKVESEI